MSMAAESLLKDDVLLGTRALKHRVQNCHLNFRTLAALEVTHTYHTPPRIRARTQSVDCCTHKSLGNDQFTDSSEKTTNKKCLEREKASTSGQTTVRQEANGI